MHSSVASATFLAGFVASFLVLSSMYMLSNFIIPLDTTSLVSTVIKTSVTTPINDRKQYKCLTLTDMKDLVARLPQVFLFATTKAGGTSFKSFAKTCAQSNVKNLDPKQIMEEYHVPSIISEHIGPGMTERFLNLLHQASTSSLIIHSHRLEISRLKSAIIFVIRKLVDPESSLPEIMAWSSEFQRRYKFKVKYDGTNYFIPEGALLVILKEKSQEIRFLDTEVLTCDVFDSLQNQSPQFIFMNYQQSNRIQSLLSEKHCPGQANIETNKGQVSGRGLNVIVKVPSDHSQRYISDWVDMKINILQWAYNMKQNNECQGKIRIMEKELFSCPSELIQVNNLNII